MNKELDAALCSDFPNLYRARNWPMNQTCMCWGFDVGDGWHDLIRDLSVKLEKAILALPEAERESYYAQQVKEKFGGLRFYMSCQTDEMDVAIDEAEKRASKTCETCGKPGKLTGSGWLRTSCEEHAKT